MSKQAQLSEAYLISREDRAYDGSCFTQNMMFSMFYNS